MEKEPAPGESAPVSDSDSMVAAAVVPAVEINAAAEPVAWSPNPLWRLIATHNPFYAISAALVFYGLRVSFTGTAALPSAVLMASLAAYVLLLTTTAVWLRRLGTLWEDLRMLALLVLLLLLGMSVTFDQTLLARPALGRGYFFGGWLFAVAICETLLHGLRVRLPAYYRIPFHALLALFFLYPLGAAERVAAGNGASLNWFLFGFGTCAASIFLILLPAVWRGPSAVDDNGTPWRWPLFPLTLFAFLGAGVVGRAYYLCYSFSIAPDGQSIFGLYFLLPLAVAVSLLILVGTSRHASSTVATQMLILPFGWLALTKIVPAKMGYDPTFALFQREWTATLGSGPAAVAVIAAVAFYGIAWFLRVPGAFGALIAALSGMSLIHGPAQSVFDRQPVLAAPFVAATLLVWIEGLRHRDEWLCCCGAFMVTAAVGVAMFRRDDPAAYFTTYHAGMAALALVGLIFYDARGSGVRIAVIGLLLLSGSNAVLNPTGGMFAPFPAWATFYPWLAAAASLSLAYLFRDSVGYVVAAALLVEWCGIHGSVEYARLRRYVPGLDAIVLGLLAFCAAVGVSLAKARRPAASTVDESVPATEPPNG